MMDIRVTIRAQIAAAEEEQRQHQAAAANSNASALICAGVIRGAEMLLAQIEMNGAAMPKDIAVEKSSDVGL